MMPIDPHKDDRELRFSISRLNASAMVHMEPARIIDKSIEAMRCCLDMNFDMSEANREVMQKALDDLVSVRNAWVLLIGTARLQIIGGGE